MGESMGEARIDNARRAFGRPGRHARRTASAARPMCARPTRLRRPRQAALLAASALVFGCGSLAWTPVVAAAPATSPCPNEAVRTGPSARLPDCRSYEQVSPTEKDGQDAVPLTNAWPAQAAPDGEAIAYTDYGAFSGAAGSDSQLDGHLSARGEHGWQTTEVTPVKPVTKLGGYISGYDYSEDLSRAILKLPFALPGTGATPGAMNLFRRNPDGSYAWINAKQPPVPPTEGCAVCIVNEDEVAYAGASADFAHTIFVANASLAGGAPEGPGIESLYENDGGAVRYVGVLPDGKAAPGSSEPGAGLSVFYSSLAAAAGGRIEHAISEDGTRVVFQAEADGGAPDPAQSGAVEVYDRMQGRATIELSAPAPGAAPANAAAEPARFWAASSDGTRVFFTSSAELTTASNTGPANGGEDLYEYDLQTKALADLSVDGNPLDSAAGAMVQGVVGASRDGSYVYFVADGQLVEGAGVDGQPNLYVVHDGGRPAFIATLNTADEADWSSTAAIRKAYLTPDGRHLAFDSVNGLPTVNFPTGYDNTDQSSGEPDSEVYEYGAPGEGQAGELVCASCDPGGARPVGNAFIGATRVRNVSTPLHQPRALDDSGTRLFFASSDPLAEGLAPPAAGGRARVFEYEQAGEGGCRTQPGCIYLISPAGGPQDAVFLDADASGDNAFFATVTRLAAGDGDDLADVYDARVDGGFPTPLPAAECQGACRASESAPPAPPLLSAAAGPSGNLPPPLAPPAKKAARCPKGKHRSHGKCVKTRRAPKRERKPGRRAKRAGRGRA